MNELHDRLKQLKLINKRTGSTIRLDDDDIKQIEQTFRECHWVDMQISPVSSKKPVIDWQGGNRG